MIRQPEFVTPEVFEWALEALRKSEKTHRIAASCDQRLRGDIHMSSTVKTLGCL